MNILEQSLREYAAALDQASVEILAAAARPGVTDPPRDSRRRGRRVAVASLGALGLVALLFAVAVDRSSGTHGGNVIVHSTSSSAVPAPTAGDCPGARFDPRGNADGLPNAESVTKAAVDSVLAQNRSQIATQFHATELAVGSLVGNVVETLPDGSTTVTRGTIYVISATLSSAANCPPAPAFYNGVPLIFRLELPPRRPVAGVNILGPRRLSVDLGCPVGPITMRADETSSVVFVYVGYARPTGLLCDKVRMVTLHSPLGTRRIVDGTTGKLLFVGADKRCAPVRIGGRCDATVTGSRP